MLVYTKVKRYSSEVSLSQRRSQIIGHYDEIKALNEKIINALKNKKVIELARLFNKHWSIKKKLSDKISDKKINKFYYNLLKKINFSGGKLIGAGGGGFFLMITNNKSKTIKLLQKNNIGYINFNIDKKGSRIIETSQLTDERLNE